jgi:hypothetical protein
MAPAMFDRSVEMDLMQFGNIMKPVYDLARGSNKNFYDFEHFLNLMYILGLFQTRRRNANEEDIWQSYHRGNKSFYTDGEVLIHPAVLKAFG